MKRTSSEWSEAGTGSDAPMNGDYPLTMFVELSDCSEPAAEAEVARWLREQHLPDLVQSGWVIDQGFVYRNLQPSSAAAPEGRFLTISPADRWDVDGIVSELDREWEPKWRSAGRLNDRFRRVWADCFRLCGPTTRPGSSQFTTDRTGSAPVTGLLLLQSTCVPASENGLNDWLNRVHVPEIVHAGPFHTAYRYAAAKRVDGRRRFLQMFETDADDPAAAIGQFLDARRSASPPPPFLEELGSIAFAPV